MVKFVQILEIWEKEQFVKNGYVINLLILLKIQNMVVINTVLLQWFIYVLIYKSADAIVSGCAIKSELCQANNQQGLPYQLLGNLKNKKYTHLWGFGLGDVQLISKYDKEIRFLLCVIDIHSKSAWVVLSKYKKGIATADAFEKVLNQCNVKMGANQRQYAKRKELNFAIDQ